MTPATGLLRGERTSAYRVRNVRCGRIVREEPAVYRAVRPGEHVGEEGARCADRSLARSLLLADRPARSHKRRSPRGTPEKTLQDAWRRSAARGVSLKASDGHWYRVIYAGRWGGSYGPDFVDAVLERNDGTRVSGHVEIHVRRDGWRAHGHHKDPRYNGVTFHAFLENTGEAGTISADNRAVRELRLGPLLGHRPSVRRRSSASTAPDVPVAAPLPLPLDLSTAGEERFAARVSGAGLAMRHEGVDQALYSAVLECMGFPRNKRQFRELARRLPWSSLTAWSAAGDVRSVEDLLLWAGGFGSRPDGAGRMRGKPPAWTRPAGRPDNRPERRISGAARLAARWYENGGPARALAGIVLNAKSHRDVTRAFEAPGENGGRSLIGRGRAAEIVVNAVLPGLCAAARMHADRELEYAALDLYRSFPALPENSITREARLMFSLPSQKRGAGYGAREQQGLIYLYRSQTTPMDVTRQLPLGVARRPAGTGQWQ